MSTGIQWTDETWNPFAAFDRVTGKRGWFCVHVSDGCRSCYAESMNRFRGNGHGYRAQEVKDVDIRIVEGVLTKPLHWRKPRRVFVCSMTDLFLDEHDDEMIAEVFAIMALARRHTFQVLTKRAARMQQLLSSESFRDLVDVFAGHYAIEHSDPLNRRTDDLRATAPDVAGDDWPLPNVWCGTSVENQAAWNQRVPELAETSAAIRFISAEPLLSRLDLCLDVYGKVIHWVIAGGESGKDARPFDIRWAESIIAQCREAGVACFVKQLGRRIVGDHVGFGMVNRWLFADGTEFEPPVLGSASRGRPHDAIGFTLFDSHGGDMEEWPDDLRVRDFPTVRA